MNDRGVPTEDLERLGAEPGPSIDPAFANRLETDLRMAMVDRPAPRVRPWWQPVLVGVAVVLTLVTGGAAIRALSTSLSTELVMSAARDTEVILPDGASADGVPGLELPDGTRISVGADGSAVIDGVVLAPGSEAVVVAGRLELLAADDAERPTSSPDGSTTTAVDDTTAASRSTTIPSDRSDETPLPSSTTADPSDAEQTDSDRTSQNPDPEPDSDPNPDSNPDRTDSTGATTTVPTTAVDPAPTTAPATTSPSTRPPTSSSTSTGRATTEPPPPTTVEAGLSVALQIEAVGDARLRLDWTLAGRGPDVLGYEVQVLSGRRLRTILVLRDGAATTATVELLADQVGYRVRAIGAGGAVLATSRTVPAP